MEIIRSHFGYGLLPSLFIYLSFYIYYLLSDLSMNAVFLGTFVCLSAYFIFSNINYETILFYTGFSFPSLETRFFYLVFYYFLLFVSLDIFFPSFIKTISMSFLFFSPLIFVLFTEYFKNRYNYYVLFAAVIPNIYVDYIRFDIHLKDKIPSYDVYPTLDEEFSVKKLLYLYHFYQLKNKHASKETSDVNVVIDTEKEQILIKTDSFETSFSLDVEIKDEAQFLENINYAITFFKKKMVK